MLTAKLPEIHDLFKEQTNLVRTANEVQGTDIEVELEAKFGYYTGNGFNSNVPFVHFDRLLNKLRKEVGNEVFQESHVAQADGIRRVTISSTSDAPDEVIWQRKNRIRDFEFQEYDIRVSINTETNLSPAEIPTNFVPKVIRERTRHTFVYKDIVQVDLTEVMMQAEDKVTRPRYEVELEFLGDADSLHIFMQHVSTIFCWLRGTNLVFTNTAKRELVENTNKAVGGARANNIDKDVLVEARNIKRRDIVYGGVVGNKDTNYVVTIKADGIRKMLIIDRTGIWLVYPPFEYNLVMDLSSNVPQLDKLLTGFGGTIFDGELVEPKQYRDIKYWYLGFDCLAFRGKNIQAQAYSERKRIVEAISGTLKTNVLLFDAKESKEITSVPEFFKFVGEFLDKRAALPYGEDGLVFTPAQTVYNPHSQDYELKERVLTRIPDVCKWKDVRDITIDFALKWVAGDKLELYSYDAKADQMVIFQGDSINPFTTDMIDATNAVTKGLPTNTVVEYEWLKDINMMRPRRVRYDKAGPNGLAIAQDNWGDIMNPVTEDDIRGNSLKMVFAYHNRVKRGLYAMLGKGLNILDIGSGMGGDVATWQALRARGDNNTGLVVAVEPNADNRKELVSRLATFKMQDRVVVVESGGEDTVAITNAVRTFIPGGKIDAITLMLSMSFFWASSSHLDSLVNTITNNLKPGGKIVFLTIDGNSVQQLFEPAFGNEKKTDITIATADLHLYPKPPAPFGRPLDFILPGTIVGNQREYLVHLNDFTNRLKAFGFELTELHRAEDEKLLSQSNHLYSSLFSYGYYDNVEPELLNLQAPTVENIKLLPVPPVINNSPPKMSEDLPVVDIATVPPKLPSPIFVTIPGGPRVTIPPARFVVPLPAKKITKFQIEQTQLPWLQVSHSDRRGRLYETPAINDDTYAPLKCTWHDALVRIATIGDGSCFIHAILKAFYRAYQENNAANFRVALAQQLRRDLAVSLTVENPLYPGYKYWQTSGRGAFPRMVMQEIIYEDLIGDLRVDFSTYGLQRLFNSDRQLGDEVYAYISDILNIDIYVLRATADDLYPHYHTRKPGVQRNAVVIIGNMYHYEVLAVKIGEQLQTVFKPGDEFLQSLTDLFVGDGGFEDIVNATPYDPLEVFTHDIIEAFTGPQGFVVPEVIGQIFDPVDPFTVLLNQVLPNIQGNINEVQVLEHKAENPNLVKLDNALQVLEQSGYTPDTVQVIRELFIAKLEVAGIDTIQDLNAITAALAADGSLSEQDAELMADLL